jgi:hypothetical protein
LDYPAKEEGRDYKTDRIGHEDIPEAGTTIWKSYAENGREPGIGESMGWPMKLFDEGEALQ